MFQLFALEAYIFCLQNQDFTSASLIFRILLFGSLGIATCLHMCRHVLKVGVSRDAMLNKSKTHHARVPARPQMNNNLDENIVSGTHQQLRVRPLPPLTRTGGRMMVAKQTPSNYAWVRDGSVLWVP